MPTQSDAIEKRTITDDRPQFLFRTVARGIKGLMFIIVGMQEIRLIFVAGTLKLGDHFAQTADIIAVRAGHLGQESW